LSTFRRVVVLLAALLVSVPGVAVAQTTTIPDDGAGVSSEPPVPLDGGEGADPRPATPPPPPAVTDEPASPSASDPLPDTGTDPRLLLLAGATLTLFGVGLRLRTADAELY